MKAPKFRSPSGYFVNLDFGFQNEINAEQDKQYPALNIEHDISLYCKKMLESRPEDALVKLVKLVKLQRLWRQ